MMRKTIIISLAVFGMGMAGCSNEEEYGMYPQGADEVYASVEGAGTRTAMQGNSVVWCDKDAISIFVQSDQSNNSNVQYTLIDGIGTGSGKFEGKTEGDNPVKVAAFYPYSGSAIYDNEKKTISLVMDKEYSYSENSNNKAPMACLIGENTQSSLSFKNAGALMCITVKNIPTGYNKATLTSGVNDENATALAIAGDAQIEFDENGVPSLTMASTAMEKTITITFNGVEGDAKTDKTFYFPLPVANYPALTVKLAGDGVQEKILKTKELDAKRSMCYTTTITLDVVSGDVPAEVNNIAAANEQLNTSNSVSIKDVTGAEGDLTIKLPGETTNKSISFDQISTTNVITITNVEDAVDGPAEVSVSVPQQAENQPKMEIDLPQSTVTLSANGEKAVYDEVTATTAENTLILSKGVTVNKLIVKGGNVRVNNGAILTAVERASEYDKIVTIYTEAGVELSQEIQYCKDFQIVDVATAELMNVLKEGGEHTLTQDLEGDFVVSATQSVTINLNGHKITNKSGDTFTVNNGSTLTIAGNGQVDNVTHQKACIYNNGTVILNGGTYTRSQEASTSTSASGGNSYYNILNHGEMTIKEGVTVTSTGAFSSLIDNGYYNYTDTNERTGYVEGKGHANPSLTIDGGEFSGGINTIKNDDGATLTINGGTFSNTTQATVQNNNVATIAGGTFNPTSSASHAVETKYYETAYNEGKTTVSGGEFNGLMYISGKSAKLTVTGGTFSDPNVLQYLGTNADVHVLMTKDEIVKGFKTQAGQSVEINMGTKTLTLADPTVGSAGTETNSCQLLKGSVVTFKSGTLRSENSKIVIQNYCTLSLENMTLETPNADYSISNNNGSCTLNNVTINAKNDGCAFDVYYWPSNGYTGGVTVTVKGQSVINGNVEFGGGRAESDTSKKGKLVIESGTINGNLTVTKGFYDEEVPNITIASEVQWGENVTGWDSYKTSTNK